MPSHVAWALLCGSAPSEKVCTLRWERSHDCCSEKAINVEDKVHLPCECNKMDFEIEIVETD